MKDLKDCVCGKDVSESYFGHYHKYMCLDCGIETRLHDDIDEAKTEWNNLVYERQKKQKRILKAQQEVSWEAYN